MDFENPPHDPLAQLDLWISEAARAGLPNPTAMSLATVNAAGQPSVRIVLLKLIDREGAVFFTNRRSRKGLDLAENPRAGLLFHWDILNRQVRIEGKVAS